MSDPQASSGETERRNPGPSASLYPAAITLGALVLLLGFSSLGRLFSPQRKLIGHPAPDFTLDVVHNGEAGSRIRLSDLNGHPVILDFWATWCEPCQVEAPVLDRLARRHRDRGLVVVGVNTSDTPARATAFARAKQLSYPVAYDDGNHVAERYSVDSLPTLVVINAKGEVVSVRSGVEGERELDRLLADAW